MSVDYVEPTRSNILGMDCILHTLTASILYFTGQDTWGWPFLVLPCKCFAFLALEWMGLVHCGIVVWIEDEEEQEESEEGWEQLKPEISLLDRLGTAEKWQRFSPIEGSTLERALRPYLSPLFALYFDNWNLNNRCVDVCSLQGSRYEILVSFPNLLQ